MRDSAYNAEMRGAAEGLFISVECCLGPASEMKKVRAHLPCLKDPESRLACIRGNCSETISVWIKVSAMVSGIQIEVDRIRGRVDNTCPTCAAPLMSVEHVRFNI